jgi:hypothetical protein
LVGKEICCPAAAEILYSLRDRAYKDHIDRAYAYASKFLLDLLLGEYRLLERLRFFPLLLSYLSLTSPWHSFLFLSLSSVPLSLG